MYARIGLIVMLFSVSGFAARGDDAALLKEIDKLKRQVKALGEIIEGTAQPINLGRTSIAAVNASSVNGGRALDSIWRRQCVRRRQQCAQQHQLHLLAHQW